MKSNKTTFRVVHLWVLALILFFGLIPLSSVQAVDAGNSYMRCDRMQAGQDPGDCLIVFTTSATAATETSIKLTLDSEWVSATNFTTNAANYTTSITGIPGGTTGPTITGAAADLVSGNTIRFPLTSPLNDSTTYAFFITGTGLFLNPDASTTQLHTIFTRTGADATTADTKTVAVPTISNDQIVVTATVSPTFTFVFNNNAQSLGALSTSSIISGGGTTVTVTTNAAGGWNAWALSTNVGLKSIAAGNYTIDEASPNPSDNTPTTLSTGVEGFVLDVNATTDAGGGGVLDIANEYDGDTTSKGGSLATTYQLIASANGAAAGDVITLIPRASISGLTPAATDYTDTLTVVGAGIF